MIMTVQNQKVKDTNTDDYFNETRKDRPWGHEEGESLNQKEFISSKHMQKDKGKKPNNPGKETQGNAGMNYTQMFTDSRQEVRYRKQDNNL